MRNRDDLPREVNVRRRESEEGLRGGFGGTPEDSDGSERAVQGGEIAAKVLGEASANRGFALPAWRIAGTNSLRDSRLSVKSSPLQKTVARRAAEVAEVGR